MESHSRQLFSYGGVISSDAKLLVGTDDAPQILVNLPPDVFRDLWHHVVPFLHCIEVTLVLDRKVRFVELGLNASTCFPLLEAKLDLRGVGD